MDETSSSVLLVSSFFLLFCILDAQGVSIEQECKRNNLPTYQCKKWDECSTGKEIIQSGRPPLCGIENSVAKICCPPIAVSRPPTITTKPSTLATTATPRKVTISPTSSTMARITTPPSRRNAIAVAERKCQEYTKYRSRNVTFPGSLIGDPNRVINQPDCILVDGLIISEKTQPAIGKEFPHMASIGYGKNISSVEWGCSGSLISEQFVLSTASCGYSSDGEAKWIVLGDLNIASQRDLARPQIYEIVKRFNHPKYTRGIAYDDIALFQLNTTVEFNPFVRPICLYTLPSLPNNTSERKVIATGWGRTGAAEPRSENLLKHTVVITDNDQCQTTYGNISLMFPRGYDSSSMICAADTERRVSGCWDDGGSPIQIPLPNSFCMWSVIGVVSIGPAICGDGETPSVCTKVANYIDWIQPIVWPN